MVAFLRWAKGGRCTLGLKGFFDEEMAGHFLIAAMTSIVNAPRTSCRSPFFSLIFEKSFPSLPSSSQKHGNRPIFDKT